jgi:hypothetical protein
MRILDKYRIVKLDEPSDRVRVNASVFVLGVEVDDNVDLSLTAGEGAGSTTGISRAVF